MIRVGTRGSALALAQADWVGRSGSARSSWSRSPPPATAARRSATSRAGSRRSSGHCSTGEIDIAVHSAKDVPGELAEGSSWSAIPERQDPRDAICGAPSFASLGSGARVGTSSLRRAAQIRALREDIEIVELRGNVDTRLRKLAEGEVRRDRAGRRRAERLGRAGEVGGVLDELVPAAGPGCAGAGGAHRALCRACRRVDRSEATRASSPNGRSTQRARTPRATRRSGRRAVPAAGELSSSLGRVARRLALDRAIELTGPATRPATWRERMIAAGAAELLRAAERRLAGMTVYLVGAGPGRSGPDDRPRARADRARRRDHLRPADPALGAGRCARRTRS